MYENFGLMYENKQSYVWELSFNCIRILVLYNENCGLMYWNFGFMYENSGLIYIKAWV